MDLAAITDRIEITDLLTRYARAVGRRDWGHHRLVRTHGGWRSTSLIEESSYMHTVK